VRKTVKPVLEILAGIPTVAIGFFAVTFILPQIIQPLWPGDLFGGAVGKPFMALAAGLGIGLMIVPIIASISEDAMSAVPRGLREGAYAMGATKMEVSTKVVFPAALSGIVASIVLAISRAVGETMIVVLAAGSLTLALLVLPMVIIAAREAIRAVPDSIRQGSLALGATKWQTIRRQVLPASIPGVLTGIILAVSRALGEAAPLLLVGAAAFVTFDPEPLSGGYSALPVQIYNYATRPQEEFQALAAAGIIVMLVVLLAMNSVAVWLRNRYEQRW
jgi:ABC-type phosphate transport system permease subunit